MSGSASDPRRATPPSHAGGRVILRRPGNLLPVELVGPGRVPRGMLRRAASKTVVFAMYDGVQMLDIAGPAEVFALANQIEGGGAYDLHFISPAEGQLGSSTLAVRGAPIATTPKAIHTLVVPGGARSAIEAALDDPNFVAWLRLSAGRAHRVVSVCTGAFFLAAIGLLDGRRATTHWSAADRLADCAPRTTVDAEALYVEDGRVWTSAGITAGIDLALALAARDYGPACAFEVARELVVPLVRPGGQSQFSRPLSLQRQSGPDLARLIPWLEQRLDQTITVPQMASELGMSERSFQRQCTLRFAMSPGRLVTELRLERARILVIESKLSLSEIADRTGFADAPALSKAFRRRFGMAPAAYGRSFDQ